MRKTTSILCLCLFLLGNVSLLLFQSCKKNAEDPGLSFITRTSRLAGDWELEVYFLIRTEIVETELAFSSIQCDTSSLSGKETIKTIIESQFNKPTLSSTVTETNGSIGTTKLYEIDLDYRLKIDKNGTYNCRGSYEYEDDTQDAIITGNFTIDKNIWFWESSSDDKTAVTFLNFPMINMVDIEANESPIEFVPAQVFDVRKLSNGEIKFQIESARTDTNTVTYQSYALVISGDTINTCAQLDRVSTDINSNSIWTFK